MCKEQKLVIATANEISKHVGRKKQPYSWISTSNAVVRDACIDYFRAREELWKKSQEGKNETRG